MFLKIVLGPRLWSRVITGLSLAALSGLWLSQAAYAQSKASPSRIVSVGGALTEVMIELGAQNELVGVDSTSLTPSMTTRYPGLVKLPDVGYERALSTEGILALNPSMVVASVESGPPIVLQQLAKASVKVALLPITHSFEGVVSDVQQLANLLGKQDAALKIQTRLKSQWNKTQEQVKTSLKEWGKRPKVLFIFAPSAAQVMVAGKGTAAQAMLDYAGAVNAVHQFSGYKPLTPEAVISANPDLILFTTEGLQAIGGVSAALKLPGLAKTQAGKHGRIMAMPTMPLLGFGPNLPQSVAMLNAAMLQAWGQPLTDKAS